MVAHLMPTLYVENGLGGIVGHFVVGFVPVLEPEIVVFNVEIEADLKT